MVLKIKQSTILSILLLGAVTATSNAQMIWTVGLPGDGWAQGGTEGGPETNFVLESNSMNDLPGDPNSTNVMGTVDDDYYFAGFYETVLDGGDYEPWGVVETNEMYAERALVEPFSDPSLRYHFNLPEDLGPGPFTVQWSPHILDAGFTGGVREEGRHGVEVYFNGRLVGPEQIVTWDDFDTAWFDVFDLEEPSSDKVFETPPFTLEDVNGKLGLGYDNYVELRHVSYFDDGGGAWLGLDHVALHQQEVETESCDFDTDDDCDVADLDALLYTGIPGNDSTYDLDGSGTVDLGDRDEFISQVGTFLGDFDLDGQVVAQDLNIVGGNWLKDGITSYGDGDANGDGTVNAQDLNAVGSNWQNGVPAGAAVPEPQGLAFVLMALIGLLGMRRRRK